MIHRACLIIIAICWFMGKQRCIERHNTLSFILVAIDKRSAQWLTRIGYIDSTHHICRAGYGRHLCQVTPELFLTGSIQILTPINCLEPTFQATEFSIQNMVDLMKQHFGEKLDNIIGISPGPKSLIRLIH